MQTKQTNDYRCKCRQPFTNKSSEGMITTDALNYNLYCEFTHEEPIDVHETKACPSKRSVKKYSLLKNNEESSIKNLISKTDAVEIAMSPSPPLVIEPDLIDMPPPPPPPTIIDVSKPPAVGAPPTKSSEHMRVKRSKHLEHKIKAEKYDKITHFTNHKRCTFSNPVSKRFTSLGMSFAPMLSLVAATRLLSLACYAIFREIGVDVGPKEIVHISPTTSHIRNMMFDTAAEILVIARRK